MERVDRLQAAAESRLERLDDEASASPSPADPAPEGIDAEEYGFHLDDPETDLLADDLDAGLRDDVEADALDAAADAFNARDLEGLLDVIAADGETPGLLGYDRDNLGQAIESLWQRRPSCCVTRGRVDQAHVGVLWEHDGTDWWRAAVVHVDDVVDGQIGVLEFSEDGDLLERVECEAPEGDLDEGARWVEWDEGAEGA
jgi:hypothetical protein